MTQQKAIVLAESRRERVTERDMKKVVTIETDFAQFERVGLSRPRFESMLIGLVINDETLYPALARIVEPGDFFSVTNGTLWKAMSNLFEAGQDINLITVEDELRRMNISMSESQIVEIAQIASSTPINATPEHYAQGVREASVKRRVAVAADRILAMVLGQEKPLDQIVLEANGILFRATEQSQKGRDTSARAAVSSLWDQVETAMNNPDRRVLIPTYLKTLDDLIGGFAPGELTILAGNNGMGKTAAMLTLVYNMLAHAVPVVYFALEMTREEVISVLISMASGINKGALRERKLSQKDFGLFIQASKDVAALPLRIYDKHDVPSMSPTKLRTELRYLESAESFPFEIAFIDGLWLQEIEPEHDTGERHRNIHKILVAEDKIAGEFNIPMVIAHQYSSDINMRSRKRQRPMLSDLSESAAVRRNVPFVIGLHRKSFYTQVYDPNEFTEWHVLKNRNGSPQSQNDFAETRYLASHSMHVSPGTGSITP